jgi:RNA polymerase sigma-70 factor (ECF subfamily)
MPAKSGISVKEYERLLEPVLGRAGAVALSIVRNRADAEDAVQDAALKGLRGRQDYDAERPFKGWFFTILRNCCRDLLRRRKTSNSRVAPLDEQTMPPAPSRGVGSSDDWEDLARAIERLSPPHQQILQLKYFGGCSYAEISAALDIPQGTVMSRLHAARTALGAVYQEQENAR